MIGGVGSAAGPRFVAGGGGDAGGVVARPGLFGRLGGPARVTVVSAPAGSGKTVLLRSWIAGAGLAGRAAWVAAGRQERDPQRFWLSVAGALRATGPGAGLVRAVTAAPDLDGWALAERLLSDLAPLAEPVWLVVDDVHELGPDALAQLELVLMRAPAGMRFVLAARHDVRLGLHRLRLEGGLAELRAADLRFTLAEARQLFTAAGVQLDEPTLAVLHERTEGWVAGLRLAALALAGGADPGRFAAEFSGSERTVAEYLLAEVLESQSERVRRLLLRTSILERVSGELAGLLTGEAGGERVLQDLEAAGAFVVPLDAARSWFRYHQMFAGLLRLELRRTEPGEVTGLHAAAAGWLAAHGFAVEAIRHAQAAGGDRQGRARRPRCRRCRPRAGTGPVRDQRRPDPVPVVSRCGPAGASCPAPNRPRRPGRGDPQRARRDPGGAPARGAAALPARALLEPLSGSEVRVLRYLPTNLSAPEIARELSVSPNTVKTHIRHLYAKFGTHHRAEAVDLARDLGLLAPARTSPASR